MPLLREVDSLDAVPEWAKAGYKQVGEKFVNEDVEDVIGLKNTIRSTRQERDTEKAAADAYRKSGLTAEQVAEVKAKADKITDQGGTPDVEALIEKRIKKLRDEELDPTAKERDAYKAEVRQLKLTDRVKADFLAAKGLDDSVDLMLGDPMVSKRFELNEKGKIVVLDDDGDPTGMTPKEWFEKVYKTKRGNLFNGIGASGGGATGGGSGGSGADALAKLSPADRLTEIRRRKGT